MKYTFFDIECANCFQGRGKICSFGYVVTDERFNVLKKEDIVIDPHSKFHLTGRGNRPGIVLAYNEEEFKSAPRFPHFYRQIRELLTDKDSLIFGFSVISDAGYIKSECERYKKEIFDYEFIDVQRIFTDMNSLSNTPSLLHAVEKFDSAETQDVHKSDDDAFLTMKVLKGICESTSLSVTEVIEKYPNGKCWCKEGVIDTEYTKYKELIKAQKLSKMEKLTCSPRKNWICSSRENHYEFSKYISRVFSDFKADTPLRKKKVCISNLYEDYHFAEMMNIVSLIARKGGSYTSRVQTCDIFVETELKNGKGEEYSCYRKSKLLRLMETEGKNVEIISFEELLNMLGVTEDELKIYDKNALAPLKKKRKIRAKA
ncbi:MAG: hypothetical protein IJW19_06570 [Clostridia bacterium]|nr:hypothetical protein [Clostridia bacterium]